MKKRRFWFKLVAIILAVLILGSLGLTIISTLISSVRADNLEELEKRKEESQREREALEQQQQELKDAKAQIQQSILALSDSLDTIQAEKERYDELIRLTMQEYDNLSNQIILLEEQIEFKRGEYDAALEREEVQWESFRKKFREMEERGNITYLEILFDNLTGFGDLLTRMDMIDEIVEQDEGSIEEMEQAKVDVALAQQALFEVKHSCEEKQEEQLQTEKELQALVSEATLRIHDLEDEMAAQQASADELQERIHALEEAIALEDEEAARISEQIAEMERLLATRPAGVASTGTYLWPSADTNIVTSRYGNRLHPILGYWRMHSGIDIGASYGTKIMASDGGTVVTSTSSYSYGEYVMLSHGNGRYTLYAHMSRRMVDVGDVVSQGDLIGYVGSTGYATGPHIHFEIIEDNVRVNPLDYFSDYLVIE